MEKATLIFMYFNYNIMTNFEVPGNFFKQKPLTSEEYYLGVIVSRLHKCKSMKNKNKKRKYNYLIGSDAKKIRIDYSDKCSPNNSVSLLL